MDSQDRNNGVQLSLGRELELHKARLALGELRDIEEVRAMALEFCRLYLAQQQVISNMSHKFQ